MNNSCKCHGKGRRQPEESGEYVEGVVCQIQDLKENEPKTFPLGPGNVLVIKQNGNINALGTKCTHYGAPLESSAVGDGRLRCQWHGACFNMLNGDIEDFPGLDSLPCYKVTVDNNEVKVRARKSELEADKRIKQMAKRDASDSRHFVVVGGGPAGAECVEALRQEGFQGEITLVCKENYLPYDRILMSKVMDVDIASAQFRTDEFYKKYDINVLKGITADGMNAGGKTVLLSNGNSIKYDKLFIATGCTPRRLDIPGGDLKNVVTLRNYEDANYINRELTKDKEIVIVGSNFIGMECATFCVDKVKKLTIVTNVDLPFQPFIGPRIGKAILKLFQDKGVEFIFNSGISEIIGDDKVTNVKLIDGQTIKADLLLLGVGNVFNTTWLKDSGIELLPFGAIETNEYLQSSNPDVFVGGDVAFAPVWSHDNQKFAIGHFGLAHYHGKMAALNMVGQNKQMKTVPYFWTKLWEVSIRYCGHGNYDDIVYNGDVEGLKFVAFYLKDGNVVAVSSCGMDPVVSQFAEFMAQGKKLTRQDLQDDPLAWSTK